MGDFDEFNTATVSVETRTGAAGLGVTYASAEELGSVQVDDARRLVRDEVGDQVVSESTIYDEDLTRLDKYAAGSRVTLPSGRVAYVILVKTNDALGAELPAHLEVALT